MTLKILGLVALTTTAGLALGSGVSAHDRWGDGSAVSDQVKRKCCGDAEVHLLPPGSVHGLADGWHIDGYSRVVPYGAELPSPDGNEWGFWSDPHNDGYQASVEQSEMRCLFLNPRRS